MVELAKDLSECEVSDIKCWLFCYDFLCGVNVTEPSRPQIHSGVGEKDRARIVNIATAFVYLRVLFPINVQLIPREEICTM